MAHSPSGDLMFGQSDHDKHSLSFGDSPSVLSGVSSPAFASPSSWQLSRWAVDGDLLSSQEDSGSCSEAEDSDSDAGAEIAERMANSCIMEDADEQVSATCQPGSHLCNGSENLSIRTKVNQASRLLGAVTPGDGERRFEGVVGSESSSASQSSESSQQGSQGASPTSVLGQAGSQAWDLLFAAAGEVQKLARGQADLGLEGKKPYLHKLTAGVPPKAVEKPQQPAAASPKMGGDAAAAWLNANVAASLGLTAGAAAPVALPVKVTAQAPVAANEPVTGDTCGLAHPAVPAQPAGLQVSAKPATSSASSGSRVPTPPPAGQAAGGPKGAPGPNFPRPAPGPNPHLCGPQRPVPGMQAPAYHRVPHGQVPPHFGGFRHQFVPSRPGPMMGVPQNRGEHVFRRIPFQGPGLRGAAPEESLHAVVLGYGKDPSAGTGVFLPRAAPGPANASPQGEEASGAAGSSHSTTVLLPARLIHSLGLNLAAEKAVAANRPMGGPGLQRPPMGMQCGPHQLGGAQEQRASNGRPRYIPPGPISGPPQAMHQTRWGAPAAANGSSPRGRVANPSPSAAYPNLPAEWAY